MVYDITGNLIIDEISSNNIYDLSLTNNASGIYIINVICENGAIFKEKLYR